MELVLLILIVLVVLAVVGGIGGIGGPSRYGRRPSSRVVEEVVVRDDPEVVEEVVEEVPANRTRRRRIVEY